MSTVTEIVEAVRQLSPAERSELVLRLEPIFLGGQAEGSTASGDYTNPEFTARLVQHFHAAKRAALARAAAS